MYCSLLAKIINKQFCLEFGLLLKWHSTTVVMFNVFPNPICYFFFQHSKWTVLSSCSLLVLSELIVDEIKRRPSATAYAAL